MSKKNIGIFYVLAILASLVGALFFFRALSSYNNAANSLAYWNNICSEDVGSTSEEACPGTISDIQQRMAQDQGKMIQALAATALVGGGLGLIALVGALVNLARAGERTWFLLVFFFGSIMLLIYLIDGPRPLAKGEARPQRPVAPHPPPNYALGVPIPPSSPQASVLPQSVSVLEILRQRYARGEIDTATFDEMRARLEAQEYPRQ